MRTAPRLTRAEQRDRTSAELVAAAERLFVENGFHATSVDQIATAAGKTKGAVYSNFASKEDLFFAVYERRAEAFLASTAKLLRELGPAEAMHRLARDTSTRRNRDDGWMAVYFEFWAHVLRHPELRERFAELRARTRAPLVSALEQHAAEQGATVPFDTTDATVAMMAAQLGIALERLTDPGAVADDLGERVSRIGLEQLLAALSTETGAA